MAVYFVSDLHIWGPEDPLYLSLLSLIRKRVMQGDILVLAGDIFDLFVGNKEIYQRRYFELFQELHAAGKRGVQTHYVEGNHDFLIQQAFQGIPGLEIHPHDVSFQVGGKRFFVAHGDTVDLTDYGYRILRMAFRSPFMKLLLWLVPGQWLDEFGKMSSRRSRQSSPVLMAGLPHEKREFLRKVYRSYAAEKLAQGYDFVVMGHCHDLDEMCFHVGGRPGQYVNVGYPRLHGSYLSWVPGEEKIQREKLPD